MASTMRFDRWEDTLGNSVNMTQVSGGSGLVPVVPSSVTVGSGTGSANSMGLVTFSGASTISLNNVFSSAYNNYRLIFSLWGSVDSAAAYLRFRSAGTDNTAASYYFGGWLVRSTGANGAWAGTSATSFDISRLRSTSTIRNTGTMDIYSPNLALNTALTETTHTEDVTSGFSLNMSATFVNSTQFDGVSLFPSSGTMSGTLQVYGYR